MDNIVLFDLDGTLADFNRERIKVALLERMGR